MFKNLFKLDKSENIKTLARIRLVTGSTAGCFLSLLGIGYLTWRLFPQTEPLLMMAAFGSSAVLIFTVPEILTAQPWPAIVSHVLAAMTGVFVRENFCLPHFAAVPLVVALSVFLMYLTRSIHPPAGGTSIVALNADGMLASYGYGLAFFPLASGMIILVALAVIFNSLVVGRRYPHNPVYGRIILGLCRLGCRRVD